MTEDFPKNWTPLPDVLPEINFWYYCFCDAKAVAEPSQGVTDAQLKSHRRVAVLLYNASSARINDIIQASGLSSSLIIRRPKAEVVREEFDAAKAKLTSAQGQIDELDCLIHARAELKGSLTELLARYARLDEVAALEAMRQKYPE